MTNGPPTAADLDRERRLDEVIAAYLNGVRSGTSSDRQRLLDQYPDLAGELREFFRDRDRFERMATPLRAVAPPPAPPPPRAFGDYEELEEIARGGMGVVFKARQKSLNRRVALKMLLAGPLASADDLRRFRSEAEAAASLEHPHIVPIYEVGTHEGFPYLSMKLMEGGSLAQAIGRPPWVLDGPASARRVGRLLVAVARAVHFAHQRGILHRDLKPANVLLDAAGQPHVSDFGLAKRERTPPWARPTAPPGISAAERAPHVSLTHTGAILGTPAYMAPEQASGERGAVTTAADVYGLGAILYELLTGRPPFRAATPLDTMRHVLEREPTPPRTLNPRVDRDLDTICLKCLEKQSARRYGSAEELAQDLERYLAGESILARPVGRGERAVRWVRRRPAVAALTLALAGTLAASLTLLAGLWLKAEWHAAQADTNFRRAEDRREALEQEQARVRQKNAELERARAESDASFRLAHAAVRDFTKRFGDELKQHPNLQPLHRAVLEAALVYFQEFVRQRGHDPALRRELAETYSDIAKINDVLGSRTKAVAAYREALKLYDELCAADPDNRDLRRNRANWLNNLARLLTGAEKLATYDEARREYEAYLSRFGEDVDVKCWLANTLKNMGSVHGNAGQFTEARRFYERAIALQLEVLRAAPRQTTAQIDLAGAFHNYGIEESKQPGGTEQALCSYHASLTLREDLARRFPRDASLEADVVAVRHSIGVLLRDQGKFDEALPLLRQALARRKKLADANPNVARYRLEEAASHTILGDLHASAGDRELARGEYEQARDAYARLARAERDEPMYRQLLANSWFSISNTHGALKQFGPERDALRKACDLLKPLIAAEPDNLDYRHDLGRVLNNLGLVLGRLNDYDGARAALHRGVEQMELAYARVPESFAYRRLLNANLGTLGEIERAFGHPDRAAEATLRRRALWADNPGEMYRVAADLARAVALSKEAGERRRLGAQTVEVLRQAQAAGFRDAVRLRRDPAFDALRARADFGELIAHLDGN